MAGTKEHYLTLQLSFVFRLKKGKNDCFMVYYLRIINYYGFIVRVMDMLSGETVLSNCFCLPSEN